LPKLKWEQRLPTAAKQNYSFLYRSFDDS
jgi:hypothetical protein